MSLDEDYTDRYILEMDNRQNILKHSLTLFSAKGYHPVGIQEIVDNSSISKPTLYHYFGNKEGLFRTLLDEEFRNILDFLKRECTSDVDISQKLQLIAEYFMQNCLKRKEFFQIYLSICFSPPQSEESQIGSKYIRKMYLLIEEMFIEATYSHGNMRGRHRNYSTSFVGLLNSYISLLMKDEIEYSDTLVLTVVHQFSHGIYS